MSSTPRQHGEAAIEDVEAFIDAIEEGEYPAAFKEDAEQIKRELRFLIDDPEIAEEEVLQ